jgi:predicted MFS family arabinose efflux permease
MIFLVDFVARGLGQGLQTGAQYWVLFGIGATVGPLLAGAVADRIGFGRALRAAFLIEAVSVAVPALQLDLELGTVWLMASSVIVGAFVTGTVPLVLGRLQEVLARHPAQQAAAWQTATVGFALFQAVAAYGLSFLFSYSGGDYRLLFGIGTAAMLIAFVIDVLAALRSARSAEPSTL